MQRRLSGWPVRAVMTLALIQEGLVRRLISNSTFTCFRDRKQSPFFSPSLGQAEKLH